MPRRIERLAALALGGVLVFAGAPAGAEVRPGETQGLGLLGPEVPPVLKAVATDPYRAPAEPACQSIPQELAALNEVLGPDADQPTKEKSRAVANLMGGAVRSLIPYRSVVRFITRAGDRDKALTNAVMAGYARRGFLRGLEANLHCAERLDAAAAAPDAAATVRPAGPVDLTDRIADPAPTREALAALQEGPGR